MYISLYHLSTRCRNIWTSIVFWIAKMWSHNCLYKPRSSRYMYHTNMGLLLGRVFSTTIKYSTPPVNKDGVMLACDCNDKFPRFVYKRHGHVHTGDLDLIENISLHNIMKMGAKFWETTPFNKYKWTHLYRDAIEKLTNKLARFAKSKSIIFDSWEESITRRYW